MNALKRKMQKPMTVIRDIENSLLLQSVLEQGMAIFRAHRQAMVEQRSIDSRGHFHVMDLPPDMRENSNAEV
jgi:hypothetical protein